MRSASLFMLTTGLGACSMSQVPTLKEYGDSALGLNISVVRDIVRRPTSYASTVGWQERTYTLPNGHWVYVEPDRQNCEIHYEVDGNDIIVGYTPVGRGCRYQ
ncbi:MAG: hypothetical protein JNK40_10420 [Chromatiales bacterium]|nr:hypothetical protein [Chromatiales bacterium]